MIVRAIIGGDPLNFVVLGNLLAMCICRFSCFSNSGVLLCFLLMATGSAHGHGTGEDFFNLFFFFETRISSILGLGIQIGAL